MREEVKDGLIGIVIFSDGQHNWGKPPGDLAYQLGHTENKPRVPVYTVVCGARVAPPDLAITSLKATPPIVFKHGIANVEMRLPANNLPPGKIKITVAYPEAPELPERKPIVECVDFDGASQPPPRTIPVKMERAALEKLTVSVELLPNDGSKAEDRFPENNSRQVVVNVAPDKAKVLVVDGEMRWESHYLQTALHRDETMETKTVIFDQPRLNLVAEEDLKDTESARPAVARRRRIAPQRLHHPRRRFARGIAVRRTSPPGEVRRRSRRHAGDPGRQTVDAPGVPEAWRSDRPDAADHRRARSGPKRRFSISL